MRPKFTPAVVRKKPASSAAVSSSNEKSAAPQPPPQRRNANPDEAINFFNRVGDMYSEVAVDSDEERKKDESKKKRDAAKKRKSGEGLEGGDDEEEDMEEVKKSLKEMRKQRRLNAQNTPRKSVSPSRSPEPTSGFRPATVELTPSLSPQEPTVLSSHGRLTRSSSGQQSSSHSQPTVSQSNTRRNHSSLNSTPADVVDLDSDSDSGPIQITSNTTTAPAEEEDYFTRLAREARENEARARLARSSTTPGPTPNSFTGSTSFVAAADPKTSPIVPIYITTPLLPPTHPIDSNIKVQRRYLQNLVPVKQKYCELVGLPLENCFFVCMGQRVFDRSSLKSLKIQLDEKGALVQRQKGVEWVEELNEWCVRFELVNLEVVEKREQERRRKEEEEWRRREMRYGIGIGDDEDDGDDGGDGEEKNEGGKLKIVMKAKGIKDTVVNVTKDTPISTLITSFRRQQNISDDKDIAIRFEGDELDEEGTVEDMDIDDDDDEGVCVDVYVK